MTKLYGNISLVMHFFSVTGGTEIVYTLFVNGEVSSNRYAADTLNSAMYFANLAWFRDQTPVIFISDTLQKFVFW